MRALILVAGASLCLAACGDQGGADNAANANADLAAEAIFANDTTAIDAATGDAANMAADVDYTVSNAGSGDVRADGSVDRRTVARRQNEDEATAANADDSAPPAESAVETNEL
jgi:hypothetical protein